MRITTHLKKKLVLIFTVLFFLNYLFALSEQESNLIKQLNGKVLDNGDIVIDDITIHRAMNSVSFKGQINMLKGVVEVLIATDKGRLHEAIVKTDISPFKLQFAMILAGFKNGGFLDADKVSQGTKVSIEIGYDKNNLIPIQDIVLNASNGKKLSVYEFIFVGSSFSHTGKCLAEEQGNIVNLNSENDTSSIISPFPTKEVVSSKYKVNMQTSIKNDKIDFANCANNNLFNKKKYKLQKDLYLDIVIYIKLKKGDNFDKDIDTKNHPIGSE